MVWPYVITHNIMSLDGRIRGFMPDVNLYYESAAALDADCIMTGSDTVLKAMEHAGVVPDKGVPPVPAEPVPGDDRPLLTIVDSRGRIKSWQSLRDTGYWRELMALVSRSTPQKYLDYLEKWHVKYIMAGDGKVDLRLALDELGRRGIKKVRTDSGGTINGVLLRQRLVDEVSVLLHPTLVGDTSHDSIFRDVIPQQAEKPVNLCIVSSRKLNNGVVWLRYLVER